MSTPNTPNGSVVEHSRAAVVLPRPARVPDELVLMVVDWCDKLGKDRLKTLSALVRLAKRFNNDVERRLYSRVTISDELSMEPSSHGAVRYVLVRRPSLRRLVQAVELSSLRRYRSGGAVDGVVAQVLGDLPAVSEITCHWDADVLDLFSLIRDRPAAFATLHSLRAQTAYLLYGMPTFGFRIGLKTLELTDIEGNRQLGALTSSFANILTRLSLSVSASVATCDPALYPSLQHLSLSSDDVELDMVRRATSAVVTFLKAAATSASLLSFEWQCTIAPSDGGVPSDEADPTPAAPFPITNAILAAVPRQIRHLSLLTDCFAPADVAAYLGDDAQRPPHLATLRIGGALGRGLGRILGGEGEVGGEGGEGSCGALAGVLERAGVEVTTVE
ncbi:uncharacterized protein RHOBADRAFT_46268 [Rhodotorula graminis WP1]|uniref:F-box domain-containing protein n=1 Tax=Rhodotorula graminis (strain WP1) TaxID=578459 RepID=A0A0P9EII8_RHOGW|nr:uncharacterized protein RHOBADRAFT_46268 [Rhodotorula graminis WP1]KPV73162.1 hypothetical protein RHOBADRAFT_46268 [Rhodotorula graminis WP1]